MLIERDGVLGVGEAVDVAAAAAVMSAEEEGEGCGAEWRVAGWGGGVGLEWTCQ